MIPATLTPGAFALSLTWGLPALTILVLALLPEARTRLIRGVSLASALLNLALVAGLIAAWPAHRPPAGAEVPLAFAARLPWFSQPNISYFVGVDGLSLLMMLLAAIIAVCGVLVSWRIETRAKEFFIFMQVLLAGVFGCFISFDLFTFFLFNEVTLIPTYLLIGVFGSGRKEYCAMKLNLMLFAGSALVLVGLLGLYFASGLHTFDLFALAQVRFPADFQHWAFPALFLGFGVLGALFPFHTWSPDGHSSAPTAISMFLAGVHMKLGGYGCLRVAMFLLPEGAREWMNVFLVLSTINILYGAFVAIQQTDLKYINAYSSVSHCGLVLFGYAALNFLGLRGAVLQMFSHGLLTALIFAVIGMLYGRTHTRQLGELGGLMTRLPFIGVAFTLAALAGLGLPGLSGFVAELNVFLGAFAQTPLLNKVCTVLAILSIVVTAVYLLRTINKVLHGPPQEKDAGLKDADLAERAAILILLAGVILMGVWPRAITWLVDDALQPIVEQLAR